MTRASPRTEVHVHGGGKVGRALATSLRDAGWTVRVTSNREAPRPVVRAPMVILALRDADLSKTAARWATGAVLPADAVVLHTSGARTADELGPLRAVCAGVGQMHPLLSFVDVRAAPCCLGATMLVGGDRRAVAAARRIARALDMTARTFPKLDRAVYHASAGLVAGGAAAIVWASCDALVQAGLARREAEAMLAPLLRSVADNVARWGLPDALSGVIRRGDRSTLEAHVRAFGSYAPQHLALLGAVLAGQMKMARLLGEASKTRLAQVQGVVEGLSTSGNREPHRPEPVRKRVGKVA